MVGRPPSRKRPFRTLQGFLLTAFVIASAFVEVQGDTPILKILNGNEAPVGRFPYVCSLRFEGGGGHGCGGMLIDHQWVLTAAHCVDPNYDKSIGEFPNVFCGIHDSNPPDSTPIYTTMMSILHPEWNFSRKAYDIALLKLDRAANETLLELPIVTTPVNAEHLYTAVGWGRTQQSRISERLQFVNLDFVPYNECKNEHGDELEENIMICAGGGEKDACRGDSGGPLLLADMPENNIQDGAAKSDRLVGIVSFGKYCGGAIEKPGVYTDVRRFLNWIRDTIEEDESGRVASSGQTDSSERSSGDAFRIIEAIADDDSVTVREILQKGLNPNGLYFRNNTNSRPVPLLHRAALTNSDKSAQVLIDFEADVDARTDKNDTALHFAAVHGSTAVVQVLVDAEADLEVKDSTGETPIIEAAENGRLGVLQVLVRAGANVNAADDEGWTALLRAAFRGHLDMTRILLVNGADVDAVLIEKKETALHRAVVSGHPDVVSLLIDFEAEVDARDGIGETPLHEAAEFGRLEVVRVLLDAGASKTATTKTGDRPIDLVCQKGPRCTDEIRAEITRLLSA